MAGSISYTHEKTGDVRVVRVNWTGDASDGSVPSLVLPAFGGRIPWCVPSSWKKASGTFL